MNPLRYAKSTRQRVNECQQEIDKVKDIALSRLKDMLRARGLSDVGDRNVVANRYDTLSLFHDV